MALATELFKIPLKFIMYLLLENMSQSNRTVLSSHKVNIGLNDGTFHLSLHITQFLCHGGAPNVQKWLYLLNYS